MFVKIIDKGECFSSTMEYINGVYANKDEWAKHNFYPKNGMVGELVKRTPSAFIVKIAEGIYVPMTRNGIKEISESEYRAGLKNNVCSGMDERQTRINQQFNWRNILPDMRQYFKQDVIANIHKLTCDFKYNIYLPDLEKSAEIYALDMCLEYQDKSGRKLDPMTVRAIVEQVNDVYNELFGSQYENESRERVLSQVTVWLNTSNPSSIVSQYYQQINDRYNWS